MPAVPVPAVCAFADEQTNSDAEAKLLVDPIAAGKAIGKDLELLGPAR